MVKIIGQRKSLTKYFFCHIIIIQRAIVFDTIAIEFGVPLPKALKCGTIKGSISFPFFLILIFLYSNETER